MLYLLPGASSMRHLPPWYGFITTPRSGGMRPIHEGRTWVLDNDAYSGRFEPERFRRTLARLAPHAGTCRLAAAPDTWGDAGATLAMWPEWSAEIRSYGFPAALVAQDGLEPHHLPSDLDALFIGGTNDWRASAQVDRLITAAREHGAWIHVGRVNSRRSIAAWTVRGADSGDGTHSAFAGTDATTRLFTPALAQPPLWPGGSS